MNKNLGRELIVSQRVLVGGGIERFDLSSVVDDWRTDKNHGIEIEIENGESHHFRFVPDITSGSKMFNPDLFDTMAITVCKNYSYFLENSKHFLNLSKSSNKIFEFLNFLALGKLKNTSFLFYKILRNSDFFNGFLENIFKNSDIQGIYS